MPGTLMFEGCLQAMAFYLSAMGYTAHRDGWRFQPVPKRPYPLLCRGQVLPTSKELTYEIFVEECSNGDKPYLIADLLCTVDGLKAFHARGMGIELVPDHPLSTMRYEQPEILSTLVDETTGLDCNRSRRLCLQLRSDGGFGVGETIVCIWGDVYHF